MSVLGHLERVLKQVYGPADISRESEELETKRAEESLARAEASGNAAQYETRGSGANRYLVPRQ